MTAGLGGISPARVRTQNPVLHVIEISIISNVPIKEKMFTVIIQKIFFAHSFEIIKLSTLFLTMLLSYTYSLF